MENQPKPFAGLSALSHTAFPKQCPACGRRYETAEDFIRATRSLQNGASGLKSARDNTDRSIVELYRNCLCGTTLMDRFDDRRDLSRPGLKRRKLFEQLLQLLLRKGLPIELARAELIRLMRGEASPLLAEMGIRRADL